MKPSWPYPIDYAAYRTPDQPQPTTDDPPDECARRPPKRSNAETDEGPASSTPWEGESPDEPSSWFTSAAPREGESPDEPLGLSLGDPTGGRVS